MEEQIAMINFIFDDPEHGLNFAHCEDTCQSGIRRFSPCPITTTLVRYKQTMDEFVNMPTDTFHVVKTDAKYKHGIISTGVNHSPDDWCPGEESEWKSVLASLSPTHFKLVQERRALLLLDQSHEGYQTTWLWQWFHDDCDANGVDADCIVYVTGNLLADKQYKQFADANNITKRIKVIPHTHFENMIHTCAKNRVRLDQGPAVPTYDDHIAYKSNNNIRTYNALQKRIRAHRTWLFKKLYDAGLLKSGLCSMNEFTDHNTYMEGRMMKPEEVKELSPHLPSILYNEPNNAHADIHYITRFNDQTILDSWVTVISEASFADCENTCFLSEKTFKSIACNHPFIIYGNKYSLQYLRDMGYKTFAPHINEHYDKLNTWERLDAIITTLQQIDAIEDKLTWFAGMKDILQHNAEVLAKNSDVHLPDSMVEIVRYYRKFFYETV